MNKHNTTNTNSKFDKSAYDHDWYLANRQYKKMYNALSYKISKYTGSDVSYVIEYRDDLLDARDSLVESRKRSIKNGTWY